MKMTAFLVLMLGLFLSSSLSALPSQVILIRHAEKALDGEGLSIKGKERAAAFVPYFTETPSLLTHGPIVAIYATAAPELNSSRRAIYTVTPLSEFLRLTVKGNYARDNYKRMAEEIKTDPAYHGKNVLICWEHQFIPEIVRALGSFQAPSKWSIESFDRTWIITFSASGKTSFQNIPQRLLYGDTSH